MKSAEGDEGSANPYKGDHQKSPYERAVEIIQKRDPHKKRKSNTNVSPGKDYLRFNLIVLRVPTEQRL
jgi:hypothetical protein